MSTFTEKLEVATHRWFFQIKINVYNFYQFDIVFVLKG